ncbi:RNA polymerase sigma factor [Brevundimonas sp.]|uniref:RNA polymerase sigma factor n=1 Tax=Brevundimonas sp. TaxID=1871086 RepID=UPI0025F8CB43|nr:RNA polymerase sigma factor [Brevundimonas sp.]
MSVTTSSLSGFHDLELAAFAAAGGRREFGELVRRHSASVRGLLRRMGAEASLADDVAQDAFIQAFERCSEFRGEGSFAAWVRKIAARLYIKRRSREARWADQAELDDQPDQTPDRSRAIDLDQALKSLSEIERVCVSLCHGAGLTHSEIAAATNLPLGTVKSHVKRGLDKLRARLDAGPAPEGRRAHVGA